MNFETADGLHVGQVLRLKAVPLWAGTLRELKPSFIKSSRRFTLVKRNFRKARSLQWAVESLADMNRSLLERAVEDKNEKGFWRVFVVKEALEDVKRCLRLTWGRGNKMSFKNKESWIDWDWGLITARCKSDLCFSQDLTMASVTTGASAKYGSEGEKSFSWDWFRVRSPPLFF